MLNNLPFKSQVTRLLLIAWSIAGFQTKGNAQTSCGNLSVQVTVVDNTTALSYEGSYTIRLSGQAGEYLISAENAQTCVVDEDFCNQLGGSWCDEVPCQEEYTLSLADAEALEEVTISNLSAGDYTFTLTGNGGCSYSQAVHVGGPPCDMVLDYSSTPVSAPGIHDGAISVSTSNATGEVWIKLSRYNVGQFELIDSILNNGSFTGLEQGSYFLDARDEVECFRQFYLEVEAGYCDLGIYPESTIPATLNGAYDGSITINGTSSFGNVEVAFAPLFGESPDFHAVPYTFTGIGAGDYAFVGRDAAGCIAYDTVTMYDPACALYINTYTVDASPGVNGRVEVDIFNGVPDYAVLLYDADNIRLDSVITSGYYVFSNLAPGDYSLKVSQIYTYDVFGTQYALFSCETFQYFSIGGSTADCSNLSAVVTAIDVSQYGAQDGQIEINTSGGNGDVTITLNGDCEGDIFLLTGMPSQQGTDLVSKSGWWKHAARNKDQISIPSGYQTNAPATTLSPTGDDTVINSGIFSGLAPGEYHLCISDSAGCELLEYVNIGSALCNIETSISSSQPSANQSDGSIVVEAAIAGSTEDAHIFIVQGNYGVINDGFNAVAAYNLPEGTYYINTFGPDEYCYRSDTIVLNDNLNCDVAVEVTAYTGVSAYGANDGTISVTSSSSFGNVTLSLSAGQTLLNQGTFSGLGPGTYNVYATDEAGCTAQSPLYNISSPPCDLSLDLDLDLPSPGQSNGEISISTGGVSDDVYIIVQVPSIIGFITIASGVNQLQVINLESGYYNITAYTDDYQYCNEGAGIFLPEEPCVLNAFATAFDASGPYNNDGYIIAGANGGSGLYTFTGPGTQTAYNTFSNLAPGTYSINVSDITGCTATVEATVSSPGCFELAVFTQNVTTYGGSDGSAYGYYTDGASTGNVLYQLYKNGTLFATLNNNLNFEALQAGDYQLTGSDEAGCYSAVNFSITQPNCVLDIQTQVTDVSIFGGSDGIIEASATGGLGNLTIRLNSQFLNAPVEPQNSPATFENLTAGGYQLIVNDEVTCADTVLLTIGQPACAVSAHSTVQNVSIHGGNNGSILASAFGGIAPYHFELKQGGALLASEQHNNSILFSNLTAGTYVLNVKDQVDCTFADTLIITELDCSVQISINATPVSMHGLQNGIVSASATGGLELYNFQLILEDNVIAGQSGTEGGLVIFNNLAAGNYQVMVTDQGNCSASGNALITEPACGVQLNLFATPTTGQVAPDGKVTATALGGIAPYQFELRLNNNLIASQSGAENTTIEFAGLANGTYTVVVTDQVNCSHSGSVTVEASACTINLSAVATDATVHGKNNGKITANATGGKKPYTFELKQNGVILGTQVKNQIAVFTGLLAGDYVVTATDKDGCANTVSVTVSHPNCNVSQTLTVKDVTIVGGSNGSIKVVTSGGIAPRIITLTPGNATLTNSGTFKDLAAGTYTVSTTDQAGCTVDEIAIIAEPTSCIAPAAVTFSDITSEKAFAQWQPAPGATKYKVQYRPAGTQEWKVENAANPSKTLSNLLPATQYEFQVSSYCGTDLSAWSPSYFFTTTSACQAPVALNETNLTSTQVTLVWSQVIEAIRYRVKVRPVGGNWKTYTIQAPDTVKAIRGLVAGTDYEWLVHSICSPSVEELSDPSTSRFFTTPSAAALSGNTTNLIAAGGNEQQESFVVRAYPNPSSGYFSIEIFNSAGGQASYEITTLDGKLLGKNDIELGAGFSKTSIDLTGQAAGIYLLRLRSGDAVQVMRLIVQSN